MKVEHSAQPGFNRRNFIGASSVAAAYALLGGIELVPGQEPEKPADEKPAVPKVKCGVIGLGSWGRELVATLQRVPQAELVAICDTYAAALRRASRLAPGATAIQNYRELLAAPELDAVLVATPTHLHKEIVLAALEAGKHVYCEAPLAHTVEDAREIARAARAAYKQIFQAGLQYRSDNQRLYVQRNIRSGELGSFVMVRAQWHKKQSWRAASPNPEREKELNWRLDKAVSPGLVGEIGIHQLDQVCWFLNRLPLRVHGYGAIAAWADGREVADTVQLVVEFPGQVRLLYDATLGSSFDAEQEVYFGTNATVVMRGSRAWLFKEPDSPLAGWEVYAKKELFVPSSETGIVIAADSSKQLLHVAPGQQPITPEKTPLHQALEAFVGNCAEFRAEVHDFTEAYGQTDRATFEQHMAANFKARPAAGYREGFIATLIALKANEAVVTGQPVELRPEWFELG
ncbi:MAG: Gfo/Idh/MocA family oxidoreductase [Verrucomicrobiae bacterium]|nr:Gfo/Idh/MocA family oxidoreductase [Verrucomicrobiae bacterium]